MKINYFVFQVFSIFLNLVEGSKIYFFLQLIHIEASHKHQNQCKIQVSLSNCSD
jgi:hypothetical protein